MSTGGNGDQNLKKILGSIRLINFIFTCKLAFILEYLSKTRLKIISFIKPQLPTWHTKTFFDFKLIFRLFCLHRKAHNYICTTVYILLHF
jgi:hypothetical protein